jgi:hypothetical protein
VLFACGWSQGLRAVSNNVLLFPQIKTIIATDVSKRQRILNRLHIHALCNRCTYMELEEDR